MHVEAGEIDLASDEERDSAQGFEAYVSSCLGPLSLKQAVDANSEDNTALPCCMPR
jgi:hypothetical protein